MIKAPYDRAILTELEAAVTVRDAHARNCAELLAQGSDDYARQFADNYMVVKTEIDRLLDEMGSR